MIEMLFSKAHIDRPFHIEYTRHSNKPVFNMKNFIDKPEISGKNDENLLSAILNIIFFWINP